VSTTVTSLADNAALLVMGVQRGIVECYPDDGLLQRIAAAVAARAGSVPVARLGGG
jgi:hypothetical protein